MHLPKTYIPCKVSVLGAARSGIAAALFLSDKGIPVFISDACTPETLEKTLAAMDVLIFRMRPVHIPTEFLMPMLLFCLREYPPIYPFFSKRKAGVLPCGRK